MKYLMPLIIACSVYGNACSQVAEDNKINATNSVFIELGGNAGFYSINYDKIFYLMDEFRISFRAGISVTPANLQSRLWMEPLVPLEINMLAGNKHLFELGGDLTSFWVPLSIDHEKRNGVSYNYAIVGRVGYRYQKKEGGLFLRLGFTPFLDGSLSGSKLSPWGGASFGYTFHKKTTN